MGRVCIYVLRQGLHLPCGFFPTLPSPLIHLRTHAALGGRLCAWGGRGGVGGGHNHRNHTVMSAFSKAVFSNVCIRACLNVPLSV